MITPTQMRAARAMLNLSQGEVASSLGIAANTLSNIEAGKSDVPASRLKEIQEYYESRDVVFTEAEGVRKQTASIKVLHGSEGFWAFYTDVYETIKRTGGDILVSNVDESYFVKWLGDKRQIHRDRMYVLGNYKLKILIQEGDYNFASEYEWVEYRWVPRHEHADVPFYAYGNKLAIIDFEEDDVTIFIHEHPKINAAYKKIFYINWQKSIIPPRVKEGK